MIKVFFIDPQSYNNLEVYDYNLLKKFSDIQIQFYANENFEKEFCNGIKIHRLFKYTRYKFKIFKALDYSISIIILFLKTILQKPDIIHIQWIRLWVIDYMYLILVKSFTSVKIVYTAHNLLPHEPRKRDFLIYKRYYKLVDAIITHSNVTKDELARSFSLPVAKIHVIPHGLLEYSLDVNEVEKTKNNLMNKYSTPNRIVFASLGVQSFYKGSDLIMDVWKNNTILHDEAKYRLLILGKNNNIDFSSIKEISNVYIEDRFLSNNEFKAILGITDVLLMPYREISQSGVLLTAINERTPVLVTDIGALSEPLNIADIGWNIGKPEFKNLETNILKIILDTNSIKKKKNNTTGWNKIHEYYNWQQISIKTSLLYHSL